MSLPVTFHRATSAEFIEASVWYETKRVGLAIEFMTEIEHCVSLATEHPFRFAVVREDIRRVGCQSFSIQRLFFRAERHRFVVLAVFHGNRDPPFGSPETNEEPGP